jgi:hypothetical protein
MRNDSGTDMSDRCQKRGYNNYLVILEQRGVITSLLPALPHDYSPGSWTAAPERINVGHKTRFLCQTGPSTPEQAMIPQQATMNDTLSPHTPSPLPADADATVTGTDIVYLADIQPEPIEWLWQHRLAAGTLAMLSGEPGLGKTWVALAIAAALTRGRVAASGGLVPSWSTRQDAQINYLSTLSIFMKQTTYLATLPNPQNRGK